MGILSFLRKDKVVEKKEKETLKLGDEYDQFSTIEKFDKDKYVEDMFLDLFHTIMTEQWDMTLSYGTMEFTKENIQLKVAFVELKKFTIHSITVQTNYRFGSSDRTFNYKSELPIGIYQYFYNVYSKVRNEENEKQRKNTELSMESIRNVIGKSGSRDRKLDILLGD